MTPTGSEPPRGTQDPLVPGGKSAPLSRNTVWTIIALVGGVVFLIIVFGATGPDALFSAADLPDFGPLLTLLAMYFLPTVIALARRHSQAPAIGALNLLLGWTILGWIGAFIWALINERRDPPRR